MDKLARTVSTILAENDIIEKKYADIYRYGLELCLTSILEISAVFFISIFVGNFVETLIFFLTFLPIRIYSGGYHADTRIKCFAILVCVYIIFTTMLFLNISYIYVFSMIPFSTLMIICIYKWAPLDHHNKTIPQIKKNKFKKISLLLSGIESIIALLLIWQNIYNQLSKAFFLGLLTALFSLVAGKIKNQMEGGSHNEKHI